MAAAVSQRPPDETSCGYLLGQRIPQTGRRLALEQLGPNIGEVVTIGLRHVEDGRSGEPT
jgi:hypothetical protein